jgi:Cys-rich repeat protein
MRKPGFCSLLLIALLASMSACDDGGGSNKDVVDDVIPEQCDHNGFSAFAELAVAFDAAREIDGLALSYQAYSPSADPLELLVIELYPGQGTHPATLSAGSYDLSQEQSPESCGNCVGIIRFPDSCEDDSCMKRFFAKSGTLTLSSVSGRFTAQLSNVVMQELGGSEDWCIAEMNIDLGMDECSDDLHCQIPEVCVAGSCEELAFCELSCTENAPFCRGDQCVECLNHAHCGWGSFCENFACVDYAGGCQSDADCAAPLAHCELASGFCVECLSNDHCGNGMVCNELNFCEPAALTCTPACAGATPHCLNGTSCVECLVNSHCSGEQLCQNNACVTPSSCTYDGFSLVYSEAAGNDDFGPAFVAYSSDEEPFDMLGIQIFPGQGTHPATLTPGTYDLGAAVEGDPETCGNCLMVGRDCRDFECTQNFMPSSGRLELESVEGTFRATLHELVLTDLEGTQTWCIDELELQAPLAECLDDSHCSEDEICADSTCAPIPVCSPACSGDKPHCWEQTCYECLTSKHCPFGESCVNFECQAFSTGCLSDEDCASPLPYCDIEWGVCAECLNDEHCPANFACSEVLLCVPSDLVCVPACSGATPHCLDGIACVECLENQHCPNGETCNDNSCEPLIGCNPPCGGSTPHCLDNTTCVECLSNSHCPNGETCNNNSCEPISNCVPACSGATACRWAPTESVGAQL